MIYRVIFFYFNILRYYGANIAILRGKYCDIKILRYYGENIEILRGKYCDIKILRLLEVGEWSLSMIMFMAGQSVGYELG